MVEQIENEGFENYTVHKQIHIERQIDYLNTIKLLHLVKDDSLANLLLEKVSSLFMSRNCGKCDSLISFGYIK